MIPSKKNVLSNDLHYYIDQCSNPVAWYHQHYVEEELAFQIGLDSVMEMKQTVLTEQYAKNQPEYVWNLFLYNNHISFYYIMKDNLEMALEIINETENILSSLTEHSTIFLDSIKPALYHITITMKGYILIKGQINSNKPSRDSFVALRDMDATNAAALYAVKSIFSILYTNRWCILPKVCLVRSISLNPTEPEWHYMLSSCLNDYRKRLRFMAKVLPQELAEAETAVHLSDHPRYKCHLAKLLYNASCTDDNNCTPDMIRVIELIRICLKTLTKMMSFQTLYTNVVPLAETIISKIMNSNNSYVRDSIGYYYLHVEKDLGKARIYLKMASDSKCFNASIDYICLLFKLDPINTDIVKILDDYLNRYTYLSSQHTLLCLVVSYQLLNKKNVVGAFKYIDELLDIKVVAFVHRMQNYKTTFCNPAQKLNLLTVIFEKLNNCLGNKMLSTKNLDVVKRLLNKTNEFKLFVHSLLGVKTEREYLNLDSKIKFLTQNELVEGKCCLMTRSSINKIRTETSTENWRTLKPDDGPNIFVLNKHKTLGFSRNSMKQDD